MNVHLSNFNINSFTEVQQPKDNATVTTTPATLGDNKIADLENV